MRGFFRKPSAQIVYGLIVGQAVVLAVTPVLTRQFSPAEMGTAAVFLAVATIAATAGTVRLELLIPIAEAAALRWITRLALLMLTFAGVVVGIGMTVFARFDVVEGALLAVTTVAIGAVALTMQLNARVGAFRGIALAKGGQGILQGGTQVLLGAASQTTYGIPIGLAVAYVGTSVIQSISYRRTRPHAARDGIGIRERLQIVRRGLALTSAAIINISAVSMLPLITEFFFGEHATGELSVAQRLAVAPAGLFVAALVPVAANSFGRLIREGQPINRAIRSWIARLLPFGAAFGIALAAIPEEWLRIFLGDGWGDVKGYLGALAVGIAAQVVAGPLGQVLALQGRVAMQFAWDAARLTTLLLATSGAAMASEDPVLTTFVGAGVLAAFYVAFVLILLITRPSIKQSKI